MVWVVLFYEDSSVLSCGTPFLLLPELQVTLGSSVSAGYSSFRGLQVDDSSVAFVASNLLECLDIIAGVWVVNKVLIISFLFIVNVTQGVFIPRKDVCVWMRREKSIDLVENKFTDLFPTFLYLYLSDYQINKKKCGILVEFILKKKWSWLRDHEEQRGTWSSHQWSSFTFRCG